MTRKFVLRPAFTLVELLVAMAIAVALLALAVGVSQSSAFESYKVTGAADRFSQYLITAKQRALRDKAPRGLRLILDETNADSFLRPICRDVAYIEQPEPWLVPPVVELRVICGDATQDVNAPAPSPGNPDLRTVRTITDKRVVLRWPNVATNADIINEFELPTSPAGNDPSVRVGDMLLIPELGCAHRIVRMEQHQPVPTMTMVPPTFAQMTPAASNPNQLEGSAIGAGFVAVEIVLGSTQAERLNAFPTSGAAFSNEPANLSTTPWPATFRFTNREFSFVRQPRPILGEPTVQLPIGTVVDLRTTKPNLMMPMTTDTILTSLNVPSAVFLPNPAMPMQTRASYIDVLFSPNGSVIGASDGLMVFLVRDIDKSMAEGTTPPNQFEPLAKDYVQAGEMVLVCVYTRTGAVATQRPNEPSTPADPYKFAKDGINTGL
jgi:prepilin-type N-terminal cleavage/methylation domain-containing protein